MTILPPVLHEADLALAERMAARLDGELYAFGDGHCAIDEVERPALRLHSVLGARSARLIAELATAAWVWGARDAVPARLELCVDLRARARPAATPHVAVREVVLEHGDTVDLAGHRVTVPLRTAIDLVRSREDFADEDRDAVQRLAALAGFNLDACRTFMDRSRNLPAKRRALERLERCL
ncbi:MAG: type IV toxin-antitoxin system AbiEi family antitoxin [Pseudolysinimonas sp.]